MRHPLASTLIPAALLTGFSTGLASAQVNDECAGAITVGVGVTAYDSIGATTSAPAFTCEPTFGQNDIWFQFIAPTTGTYIMDLCGSSIDTVIEVLEGTCASNTVVACNDDTCGVQSIVNVATTAGQSYLVRVGGWNGATTNAGFLNIEEFAAAPIELVAHYPLDDVGTTALDASGNGQIGTYVGTTNGLPGIVGNCAEFDGSTSFVEILSAPQIDPLRYDFTAMAWFNVDALPSGGQRIFSNDGPSGSWSFSVTPSGLAFTTHAVLDYGAPAAITAGTWHHVAVTMSESADVTFYFDGAPAGAVQMGEEFARNPRPTWFMGAWDPLFSIPQFYDGRLDDVQIYQGQLSAADIAMLYANPGTTLGDNSIGTQYCTANPNSTGATGVITAAGSVVVGLNDVTLTASSLPTNAFGFFIVSRNQGFVMNPNGSQGNLCVSGAIGRYVGPGQIQQSGGMGAFSLALDLNNIPSPTGFITAVQGDTFNFQAWHRDANPTPTSNFTNGIQIGF